jgi:hypothetical protein
MFRDDFMLKVNRSDSGPVAGEAVRLDGQGLSDLIPACRRGLGTADAFGRTASNQ